MSKVDAWMPLYIAEYTADTTRFTTEQHGAYLLIIMDYWRNGPPPDDDVVLAQVAKLPPARWRAIRKILAPKFKIADGVWKHKRVEIELNKARNMNEQRSIAGKASAAKRWGSGNDDGGVTGDTTDAVTAEARENAPSPSSLQTSLPRPEPLPSPKKNGHSLAQAPFVLPDWIPAEHWNAWVEARKKKRNAPTDYALRLAVRKLENLRDEGYPPAQVLMNAAFNGYTGLWPPKDPR